MRTTRSFSERQVDKAKAEALESLTLTERLLVNILIELFEARAWRSLHDLSERLRVVGLTRKQIAALLDTTPASLAVVAQRARRRDGGRWARRVTRAGITEQAVA